MSLREKTTQRSSLGKLLKPAAAETLTDKTAKILDAEWKRISDLAKAGKLGDWMSDARLIQAIRSSINAKAKTYRYVLPTQVLAKIAAPSLDSHSLQVAGGKAGSFDARTIAHGVVVPFDQKNENVLGGSQEPYVSNPLRVPEISAAYRQPQKYKDEWDNLCLVLDALEANRHEKFRNSLLLQVLTEIYRRLAAVRVGYSVPRRISLGNTIELIEQFLSEHSGGDRLLALSSALFTVIGKRFGLFAQVRRGKITAADQPSGMLADLECIDSGGKIVLAVEVKDRQVTVSQLQAKVRTIREKRVSEIFFIAQETLPSEAEEVRALVDREFASGQNVYITDLIRLGRATLAILGEEGRREFLAEVGGQLDTYKSDITHRRAWAFLLQAI